MRGVPPLPAPGSNGREKPKIFPGYAGLALVKLAEYGMMIGKIL